MANVKGKVVAITGASSGIGEAAARLLAQHGAHVVLGARRTDKLAQLAATLIAEGGSATYQALDVVDRDQMDAFIDLAVSKFGRVDVILNNAGIMPLSPLAALKVDEWNRMIDVNIRGVLHGAVRAISEGLRQEVGREIRVTQISPGVTDSELADSISDDQARQVMQEYRRISIPAASIAQAILFAIEQPPEVDVNEIIIRPTAASA